MKLLTATSLSILALALALALATQVFAQGNQTTSRGVEGAPMLTSGDIQTVSPALERYAQETLHGDLWSRPDLSPGTAAS